MLVAEDAQGPRVPRQIQHGASNPPERRALHGVPYTIFKPTYFMETLPRRIQENLAGVMGRQPHPLHMVAAGDPAWMVSRSFRMSEATNRIFFVHGPQAITISKASREYSSPASGSCRCRCGSWRSSTPCSYLDNSEADSTR
jgi:hypothetical protein